MILVAGTMTMNPAILDDFATDLAAIRSKILAEDGCHHYSVLVEDKATGLVNVLEQWDDEDALKVHLGMPWIVAFFAKYVEHMRATTVRVCEIASERPLPGM